MSPKVEMMASICSAVDQVVGQVVV